MAADVTKIELRATGIPLLGHMPWGSHLCHFYETDRDLLDAMVPYFKAGLENNEFCLWVISDPLTEEEAKSALRPAVPDFDRHLADRRIEIVSHREWYLKGSRFELQRTIHAWDAKLEDALARGFAGMRVSGNTSWIQKEDWRDFREYEMQLEDLLAGRRMIALCTYHLAATQASQLLDVARIHQSAVACRCGDWEVVETPAIKQAKQEVEKLNEELEQKVEERTRELAAANEALKREILERDAQALRYKTLMETSTDSIYVMDEKGDLQEANAAFLRRLGYTAAEAKGLNVADWNAQWSREQLQERMRKRVGGGTVFETRHRCKDGSVFDVEVCSTSVRIGEEQLFFCVTRDITERKRAEQALRESESKFRRLLASNIIGVVFWNLQGDILEANDLFLNVVGYTREDLRLGRVSWKNLTPPEYARVDEKAIGELMATGTCSAFEKEYIRKDGGRVSVLIGSALLEPHKETGSSFVMDISERKQAEDRLRRSEEKFKALFDIAPVGISVLDRQRNVVDANPALEQITRQSKEELLNGAWRRRTYLNADGTRKSPDEMPSKRAITENRTLNNVETGIVTEDGEIIWTQVSVAPLALPDASAVVITQDITERKRAAKELEEANHQLRLLSRRLFEVQEEERRHLARELHDEIGQTLTAAKLNLKTIAPDVPPAVAGRIDDSTQLLDRLLMQVRQLSLDLRPPLLDELGLVPALRWLADQQAQRAGLRVQFTTDAGHVEMEPGVRTACFRVAQEAITNAIRHAKAKTIAVEIRQERDRLFLSVRDDGAGFDPVAIRQQAARGASMGLLSMKERALLTGGGLEIDSAPGRGTEIRASFPLVQREPPSTTESA